MYIKKVKLTNFRNYKEQKIELTDKMNVFYGDNAQGKTNILEAIYLCAIGKSFRTKKEKELINFQENFSEIEVDYEKKDRSGKIKLEISDKKTFYSNGIKIKKISEILGKINIVMFSPDDIDILKGSPNKRRKFLDIMISQLRPSYLYNLNQYIKTMEQRNNYLRQIKYNNKDINLLDIWDEKLIDLGEKIYNYRKEFIEKIDIILNNIHKKITEEKENIKIEYISNYIEKNKFKENLIKKRQLDIEKGYTTIGIHRDDFIIYINDKPVNLYGSQGQNRTVVLSLKITELEIASEEIGEKPVLLLDDFMSELDEKRRNSFFDNIENIQVLITCTDKINKENTKIFNVKDGKIV